MITVTVDGMPAGGVVVKVLPLCQHCNNRAANRSRGLCGACYVRPGVKEHYAIGESRFIGTKEVPDFCGPDTLLPMPEPTRALPGTPEKIAVLEARALRRQRLWNPDDATFGSKD